MQRGAKQAIPQLRVIGGQWRGRKLQFPDRPGLRPTGDRIRETLFNWLGPHLQTAKCLDLFAGSGALGIEALSRGAGHCDFVDADQEAVTAVGHHLNTLDATECSTVSCDMAEHYSAADQPHVGHCICRPSFRCAPRRVDPDTAGARCPTGQSQPGLLRDIALTTRACPRGAL
jgi:16S rRNA (guanine966-N2)-methyltransferase